MNTCDTCRYWSNQFYGRVGHYHICLNEKLDANSLDYPEDGLSDAFPEKQRFIETGPKFGCLHHEPRGLQV